jgi:protein angel
VCKLQLKSDPTCQFVVATTHLLYNPKRQDIRLAQIQVLLAELDRISKINENNDKTNLPIILSGDFNLQPYSAPHNLIVNGKTFEFNNSLTPLKLWCFCNFIRCLKI